MNERHFLFRPIISRLTAITDFLTFIFIIAYLLRARIINANFTGGSKSYLLISVEFLSSELPHLFVFFPSQNLCLGMATVVPRSVE